MIRIDWKRAKSFDIYISTDFKYKFNLKIHIVSKIPIIKILNEITENDKWVET